MLHVVLQLDSSLTQRGERCRIGSVRNSINCSVEKKFETSRGEKFCEAQTAIRMSTINAFNVRVSGVPAMLVVVFKIGAGWWGREGGGRSRAGGRTTA